MGILPVLDVIVISIAHHLSRVPVAQHKHHESQRQTTTKHTASVVLVSYSLLTSAFTAQGQRSHFSQHHGGAVVSSENLAPVTSASSTCCCCKVHHHPPLRVQQVASGVDRVWWNCNTIRTQFGTTRDTEGSLYT